MSEKSTSIGPAAVCAATAAIFVALGGAFLVGVMLLVWPEVIAHPAAVLEGPADPASARRLELVLYAASGASFIVGFGALALALRKLP